MKASALKYTILTTVATLIILILVLMPFHAFLTVWLSTILGHYTALRLWKEGVLFIAGLGVFYLVFNDVKIRTHTLSRLLVQLILAYAVVQLIWGLIAFRQGTVSSKALGYGLIVDLRFLIFFLIAWAIALRTVRLKVAWQKAVLVPAFIVILFGLLQVLVLPNDWLRHVGYGSHTIPPYETINHNAQYVRIESTLRGANPLGAYTLIPLTVLGVLFLRGRRDWRLAAFALAALVVLVFSFSRSAWIGALLSAAVIAVGSLQTRHLKKALITGSAVVVALALIAGFGLRHNSRFENIFLHTQDNSTSSMSSNQGHVSALKGGLHDVLHQPLGRGPGTAGPASVYNNHPARISENYFVQIGQETGWLGLLLFLLINAGVGYLLWLRRRDPLALALLASLIGLSFVNLLSHAWADDTVAYVWWGLAGIAMATLPADLAKADEDT